MVNVKISEVGVALVPGSEMTYGIVGYVWKVLRFLTILGNIRSAWQFLKICQNLIFADDASDVKIWVTDLCMGKYSLAV